MTLSVEFEQRAPSSTAPFGAPMWSDETLANQLIHNTHDGWQADIQPVGDGAARDRAFPADDLQDGRTVDFTHCRSSDGKSVGHGYVMERLGYLQHVILTYNM